MYKIIITGAPGSGKTTTLNELSKKGYQTIDEAARYVIEKEQNKEKQYKGYNGIFPWTNLLNFQVKVMEKQKELEENIKQNYDYAFLDRSFIDGIAYAEEGGITIPNKIYELIEKAEYKKAFFLDILSNYKPDLQRKESKDFAMRINERLWEVYQRFNFNTILIEEEHIEERINKILEKSVVF